MIIEPNKKLGQHWLNDVGSLQAMIKTAEIEADDDVLEVGPGLGALTVKLLDARANVTAVELDNQLASELNQKFESYTPDRLNIINESILDFDLATLPVKYKVCANIPYYLTSNLLRNLCESANPPSSIALLVQKEVAERIAAKPGKMSLLSVSVQLYCDVELGPVVPAKLFTPPPKVDSQIVKLAHLGRPRFEVDITKFFKVVKAGFSERRKMLRSSLAGGLRINKIESEELLKSAGIDPTMRPQELSLEQWLALSKLI